MVRSLVQELDRVESCVVQPIGDPQVAGWACDYTQAAAITTLPKNLDGNMESLRYVDSLTQAVTRLFGTEF